MYTINLFFSTHKQNIIIYDQSVLISLKMQRFVFIFKVLNIII